MPDPSGRASFDVAAAGELEAALIDLSGALAVPDVSASRPVLDPALRARLRIEAGDRPHSETRRWRRWLVPARAAVAPTGRPIWRGSVLALVAIVAIVAVAGAIGLGLPGIRIIPAPSGSATPAASAVGPIGSTHASGPLPSHAPSSAPTPSASGPLGLTLGLGDPIAVANAATAVDIPVVLPHAPGVGGPASAWLLDGRLTFVWPAGPALPPTAQTDVGLLLSEFRGSLEPGYFEKILDQGTTIETVRIGDVTGYWISGAAHEIVYVDATGHPMFDSRRSVGDTLLWARGDVTNRLETGLGRAATVALAETIR